MLMRYKGISHFPSWSFSLYLFAVLYEPFFFRTSDHRRIETRLAHLILINKQVCKGTYCSKINKVEHNSADWIMLTTFRLKVIPLFYKITRLFLFLTISRSVFILWYLEYKHSATWSSRLRLSFRQIYWTTTVCWEFEGIKTGANKDFAPKKLTR